jgi:RNA polymerase sigma-70 factor (ECF subfamily)
MADTKARFEAQALPHLDAAYNLARWLCRSGVDAEDIVQDAMLRAYRAFEGARAETIKPWLLAIVRNCVRDHASGGRRTESLGEEAQAVRFDGPDAEDQAAWGLERRRLDRVLARLPPDFREVVVLREMEDMSYRQIADVVGAPMGTVMSRLARGRALLKDLWTAEGGDDLR